jgi:hypothetical protein
MTLSKVGPTEQFQIAVQDTAAGGELQMMWETTKATAAFTVR